jgi:hypothetical protein
MKGHSASEKGLSCAMKPIPHACSSTVSRESHSASKNGLSFALKALSARVLVEPWAGKAIPRRRMAVLPR